MRLSRRPLVRTAQTHVRGILPVVGKEYLRRKANSKTKTPRQRAFTCAPKRDAGQSIGMATSPCQFNFLEKKYINLESKCQTGTVRIWSKIDGVLATFGQNFDSW
jgi:hypothetical protein